MKRRQRKRKKVKYHELLYRSKLTITEKGNLFKKFSKKSKKLIKDLSWFEKAKSAFKLELVLSSVILLYLLMYFSYESEKVIFSFVCWLFYLVYHFIRIAKPPKENKKRNRWMDRMGTLMVLFYFITSLSCFVSCVLLKLGYYFIEIPLPLNVGGGLFSIFYSYFSTVDSVGLPLILIGAAAVSIYTLTLFLVLLRPTILFSNRITTFASICSNSAPFFYLGLITSFVPYNELVFLFLVAVCILLTLSLYSYFHQAANYKINTVRALTLFIINPKRLFLSLSKELKSNKAIENASKILDDLERKNQYDTIRELNSQIISTYKVRNGSRNFLFFFMVLNFAVVTLGILYEGLLLESPLFEMLKVWLCETTGYYCD